MFHVWGWVAAAMAGWISIPNVTVTQIGRRRDCEVGRDWLLGASFRLLGVRAVEMLEECGSSRRSVGSHSVSGARARGMLSCVN